MRHLSLCTGYGGIDLALRDVLGAETVAVADVDKGACKILGHRFPDVPNLGDITTVDWSQWAGKVDIISGGTPCQDLSHAGRRAGMTDGTRSNLWVAMREAIATIRPSLVVWENVRGAYSATADSAVEPCAGCVGDGTGVHLRALGRVLGDLSSLGFDAEWVGIRASDVGAAHQRFRVFVIAWPADTTSDTRRIINGDSGAYRADAERGGCDGRTLDSLGRPAHGTTTAGGGEVPGRVMPSPRTSDTNGAGAHGDGGPDLRTAVTFLPTTRAGDGTKGGPNQRGSSGDLMLPSAMAHLPTPMVGSTSEASHGQISGQYRRQMDEALQDWREYEPAIRRQEQAFGRPAPAPTEPGRNGNPRLSPRFTEWLMGLPAGWITDVPGITRNEALKACGNGVVPQQCAAALHTVINALEGTAA